MSLWIETKRVNGLSNPCWSGSYEPVDRNPSPFRSPVCNSGQARMSLWIETYLMSQATHAGYRSGSYEPVDRNRCCGGRKQGWKQGQARMSLWIETTKQRELNAVGVGQARMSLWIETVGVILTSARMQRSGSYEPVDRNQYFDNHLWGSIGQARMSLWIETFSNGITSHHRPVRLV